MSGHGHHRVGFAATPLAAPTSRPPINRSEVHTADALITLHESFTSVDDRIEWISDDCLTLPAATGICTLHTDAHHHPASVAPPLGYITDAWCCAPGQNLIAVATHGPLSLVTLYDFPSFHSLATLELPGGVGVVATALSFTGDGHYIVACTQGQSAQIHVIAVAREQCSLLASRPAISGVQSIIANGFRPSAGSVYEFLLHGDRQAAVVSVHCLSAFQSPIVQSRAIDTQSKVFNTTIHSGVWRSQHSLALALSTGQIVVADMYEDSSDGNAEARAGRSSSQSTATAAATEATLPVTTSELRELGLKADSAKVGDEHDTETTGEPLKCRAVVTSLPCFSARDETGAVIKKGAVPLSLALTKHHLMVGTDDGCILWLNSNTFVVDGWLLLDAAAPSRIVRLSFNSSYHSLIAQSHDGQLRVLRHVTEQTRMLFEHGPEPVHPEPVNSISHTTTSADNSGSGGGEVGDESSAPGDAFHRHPSLHTRPSLQISNSFVHHAITLPMYQIVSLGHFPRAFKSRSIKVRESAANRYQYGSCLVPGSSLCVTNCSNGSLYLWDHQTRAMVSAYQFASALSSVTVSPDGQLALCGLASGVLAIFDLTQHAFRLIYAQRLHSSPVTDIRYSASGDRFASLSASQLFFLRSRDLKVLGYCPVLDLVNKRGIMSADVREQLRTREEERQQQLDDEAFFASLIQKAEDSGKQADNEYDADSESADSDQKPPAPMRSVTPLATASDVPVSFCWLHVPKTSVQDEHDHVLINTLQGQLVVIQAPSTELSEVQPLLLTDTALKPVFKQCHAPLLALAPAKQPLRFYATDTLKQLCVFELKLDVLRLVQSHRGHYKPATTIAITGDGHHVLTGGLDGLVIAWDVDSEHKIVAQTVAASYWHGGLHTVDVSEDSDTIVTAGNDGSVNCWHWSHPVGKSPAVTAAAVTPTIAAKVLANLPELEEPDASLPSFLSQFSRASVDDGPALAPALQSQRELVLAQHAVVQTFVNAMRQRNAALPEPDQLPWFDTCVDTERRDELLRDSQKSVDEHSSELERQKRAIESECRSISEQCLGSMQVQGAQIKPLITTNHDTVTNFSIKAQAPAQIKRVKQLQFLRSMEIVERAWRFAESERIDRDRAESHRESSEAVTFTHVNNVSGLPWNRYAELWVHPYCANVDYIVNGDESQHPYVSVHPEENEHGVLQTSRDQSRLSTAVPPATAGGASTATGAGAHSGGSHSALSLTLSYPSLDRFYPHPLSITVTMPDYYLYHPLDVSTNTRKLVQYQLLAMKILALQLNFNMLFNEFAETKLKDLGTIGEKHKRMNEIAMELRELNAINVSSSATGSAGHSDCASLFVSPIELRPEENPAHLLTVHDHELTATTATTATATAGTTSGASSNSDRTAETEKALFLFMNNTLDSKKHWASTFAELLSFRPPYYQPDGLLAVYNDEQKAEIGAYEKKMKLFETELENRRKTLLVEYNKLKADVADLCKSFDYKLTRLKETKIKVKKELLIHEWLRAKMALKFYQNLRQEHAEKEHTAVYHRYAHFTDGIDQRLSAMQSELEAQTRVYDGQCNELKALEKALRKEMNDAGENFEHLGKLFKIKNEKKDSGMSSTGALSGHGGYHNRRASTMRGLGHRGRQSIVSVGNLNAMLAQTHHKQASLFGIEGLTGAGLGLTHTRGKRRSVMGGEHHGLHDDSGDILNPVTATATAATTEHVPYGSLSSDPSQLLSSYQQPLFSSDLLICPPDLNSIMWMRFVDKMKLLTLLESETGHKLRALTQWSKYSLRLQTVHAVISDRMQQLADTMHAETLASSVSDRCLLVRLQHGQVELPVNNGLSNARDICLIPRTVIEQLNTAIRAHGEDKLATMRAQFLFNAWLRQQQWSKALLQLQLEKQIDRTTQLQLLRVTKEMQIKLKERELSSATAADSLSASEDSQSLLLDRQLEFLRVNSRDSLANQNKTIAKLRARQARLAAENTALQSQLSQLNSAVTERLAIDRLREDNEREKIRNEKIKIREIINQRKLTDLIKMQKQEIAWLRGQVETLRRKTFATFATAHATNSKYREEEKTQAR